MSRSKELPSPDDWVRNKARELHEKEGFIEIDENAPVSRPEGNEDRGAYVQAWIWVEDPSPDEVDDEETD